MGLQAGVAPRAAEYGRTEMVQLLLDRRAAVDLKKAEGSAYAGRTALHCAALRSHVTICEILIQHGASLLACDARGATPLHMAALEPVCVLGNQNPSAKLQTLRLLCQARADPSVRDRDGCTAAETLVKSCFGDFACLPLLGTPDFTTMSTQSFELMASAILELQMEGGRYEMHL